MVNSLSAPLLCKPNYNREDSYPKHEDAFSKTFKFADVSKIRCPTNPRGWMIAGLKY